MPGICATCKLEQGRNAFVNTVCYKFLGHNALHVDEELCTFFHAVFTKTWSCAHVLLNFPEHFRVCDFIYQQADVLPFDNQIHFSHWNLVHAPPCSPQQHAPCKIFHPHLYMNSIPPDILQNIQIHAIDTHIRPMYYLPGLVTNEDQSYYERARTHQIEPENSTATAHFIANEQYYNNPAYRTGSGENLVTSVAAYEVRRHFQLTINFRGHCVNNVNQDMRETRRFWFRKQIAAGGRELKFAQAFKVRDFLQMIGKHLKIDHQLHMSHWNLVHASAFTNADGTRLFKVFDHHLYMNYIPAKILEKLEIHAFDLRTRQRYYLPNLVSNSAQQYMYVHIEPTVLPDGVQHNAGPPGNDRYYQIQHGGHGLFNNMGASYDADGVYQGFQFSNYIQDNPFAVTEHTTPLAFSRY